MVEGKRKGDLFNKRIVLTPTVKTLSFTQYF